MGHLLLETLPIYLKNKTTACNTDTITVIKAFYGASSSQIRSICKIVFTRKSYCYVNAFPYSILHQAGLKMPSHDVMHTNLLNYKKHREQQQT